MKLHHIAIWTFRLEELKDFYVRFLGGTSNEKYINPKKGFESYFISFDEGPTLELMSRVDVQNTPIEENRRGLTHLAFTFPSKEEILRFTEEMRSEGYTIAGEPRTSGDGYFESVVLDPDGNRLECVYKKEPEAERTEAALCPNIETKRLLLRPFQENDAEAFFACCQNPNLGNNAGWAPHKTLNESREILHGAFIGRYMGCYIKRYTAIDSFHRHRTRSETGKSSGTYAGILAGRTVLGKRIHVGSSASRAQLWLQRTTAQPHHCQLLSAQQTFATSAEAKRIYLRRNTSSGRTYL